MVWCRLNCILCIFFSSHLEFPCNVVVVLLTLLWIKVKQKLINNHPTQICDNNNEKHSLNELAKDHSVTINEADKEGANVLFSTREYINSCENLLSDATKYKNVQPITPKEFTSEAKNLFSNLHGTCALFLKNTLPDQPKPAVFYGIPEIHKLPEVIKTAMECRNIMNSDLSDQTAIDIAIEHNILPPFRPKISGKGCLTENKSAYVDKILQPFFQKIPSYIEDTTQFLNCISKIKSVLHNALIVSMDDMPLHSSIPHSDGIVASEISMIENGFTSMEISNIAKIINFVSSHNYFEFNGKSYIQTHVTAIGKKWSPHMQTYLCGTLENNCTDKPFLYLHYIDDIFVIWQHGEDKLEQFHAYVNSIHPNINLTLTSSATNIPDLDVLVSFDGTNIHTSIYTKSTYRHGYLQCKSFHPILIKKSMVCSQFIGYKHICTDKFTFEYQASNIFQQFLSEDYPF